jgi:hypothetical protein
MFSFTSPLMNAADLESRLRELRAASLKPIQGAEPDFGQKLKDAVKRRLAPYSAIQAHVAAEDETFADKLRKAVQRHPKSRGQARKNADKDRARYHKPQQRKPTKSD